MTKWPALFGASLQYMEVPASLERRLRLVMHINHICAIREHRMIPFDDPPFGSSGPPRNGEMRQHGAPDRHI